jgi:hypothetical protein
MRKLYIVPLVAMYFMLGCAQGGARSTHYIAETVDAATSLLDAQAIDPDMGILVSPPDTFQRRVMAVVRTTQWEAGLRARLQPPQEPQAGPMELLVDQPGLGALILWNGMNSEAQSLLEQSLQAGIETAPLYDLTAVAIANRGGDQEAVMEADLSWLVAHVLDHPNAMRLNGSPILVYTQTDESRHLRASMREHLGRLRRDVLVIAQGVEASNDVEEGSGGWASPCHWDPPSGEAEAEFLCASPSPNRRLDEPAALVLPPEAQRLDRVLRWARRGTDRGQGLLIVDGLGAWRDDRQLDPVVGETTREPSDLTSGHSYAAYGRQRWEAVLALVQPAGGLPSDWQQTADTYVLERTRDVVVRSFERNENGFRVNLVNPGGLGHAEFLLDGRPFVLPASARLRYQRSHRNLRLELTFADGVRLSEIAEAEGLDVDLALGAWAGLRVEEASLVYDGGALDLDGWVEFIRFEPEITSSVGDNSP